MSRFFTIAASWSGVLQDPRSPRLFFMVDQAPSTVLSSGTQAGSWTTARTLSVDSTVCQAGGSLSACSWAMMCMNDALRAEGVSIRMTGGDDDPGIPVADAIELLRDELQAALEKGVGQPVQFGIPDVTLTVSVVAGKSKDAVGKIRWWVIEAGGSGKWSRDVTQTLVLTLHPQRVKPDGTRVPLDVGAEDTETPVPETDG